MDYYLVIWAIVVFVESRVETGVDYAELGRRVGFSVPHLRAVFAQYTGQPLTRYILSRRISRAAFDAVHGRDTLLDISERYGFSNPDTFTRAFRRMTGVKPKEFRALRPAVGNVKLCAGVYGVSVSRVNNGIYSNIMKGIELMKNDKGRISVSDGSAVLYGVPKVHYGAFGGCTPYPVCLKAVANYMGINLDYEDAIVQCGAAFRLVWDATAWNGGNVDVLLTFEDPSAVYRYGFESLGYEFRLLGRDGKAKAAEPEKFAMAEDSKAKADFIGFIKESIGRGAPVIALGIVGPPEACLVTGYRDNGQTLLGWNCFQDSPEYASSVSIDESGYFVTSAWWENRDTVAVMAIGEKTGGAPQPINAIASRAVEALTGRQYEKYAKGINAYDAWKKAILDDGQFSEDMTIPLQIERLMCQGDAMDCLADGRGSAHKYFKKLAGKDPEQPLYGKIAEQFAAVAMAVQKMNEALGGWERGEAQMKALLKPETRRKLGALIDAAKAADARALELLKELAAL